MNPKSSDDPSQSLMGNTPIHTTDGLRAAIYARTSSPKQRNGYSLNEQVRQCWERCEQLGWIVSHVFRDKGVSGKDADREKFQQLLTQAESGNFDVVMVWRLDRFSRSLIHAVELERELREWDVGLHSATEMIDTTTATGRFNFRSISSASEFERDLIKQRTQMGLQALALEKKWPNNDPPIGYNKKEDDTLEIDEDEADIVRNIFSRYIEVKSMPQVAKELNSDGIRTRNEKEWTARAISDLLNNRLYIGEYSVADVEDYVEEYHLLEEALFEKATEVRTRFQRDKDSGRPDMPMQRKQERVQNIIEQYNQYLNVAHLIKV